MTHKYNGRYYNLIRSFGFAVKGVAYALRHERNLRIHFSVTAFALYFSIKYYSLSAAEYAVLLLVIGLVIMSEMFNTAIEKVVDMSASDYNGLAKISKDVAAGGVLIASVIAAAVSVILFWKPDILREIIIDIFDNIVIWIFVIAVQVIWVVWPHRKAIIRRGKKMRRKTGE